MSIMFTQLKTTIQIVSTCLSLVLNVFLIIMILRKSPPKMGNYRYLMIYFSCSAMIFSLLDIMAQPYAHTIDNCFVAVVKIGILGSLGTWILLCALAGWFGTTITCFAIHFAYRFFALERKGRLRFFSDFYLRFWFILPLIIGFLWGALIFVYLGPNKPTSDYIEASIYEDYQLTIEQVTYMGALYFFKDNTPNNKHFTGVGLLLIIMFISFFLVIQYGVRSFILIQKLLKNQGESEYSRNLQKQLYKALVIQFCFPLFLMYMPIGVYFMVPITGINIQEFSRIVGLIYALYPAVDPLPIIFIIDNYRFAVFKLFHICESRNRIQEVYYVSAETVSA